MKDFTGLFECSELDAVGLKYLTDKASNLHDYLRAYDFFFQKWRHDRFRLLELGIFKGGSLGMWAEYFPNADIIGVDIKEEKRELATDRIAVEIGDAGDAGTLEALGRYEPRIIIDDASHQWEHQLTAFFTLFPRLQPGGIYVVEDISTSFEPWAEHYRGETPVSPFRVMQELAESLNVRQPAFLDKTVQPLTPPSPYRKAVETIARHVDCVVFIKFTCLIIKKV